MTPKLEQKIARLLTMAEEAADGGSIDGSKDRCHIPAVSKKDLERELVDPEITAWLADMRRRGLCRERRLLCHR